MSNFSKGTLCDSLVVIKFVFKTDGREEGGHEV